MVKGPCVSEEPPTSQPAPAPPAPESGHSNPQRPAPPPIDWGLSYYEILKVARAARESTIRAAFKRLASLYHPDRAGSAYNEAFQRLNHIHSILTDGAKRAAYNKDPHAFPFPGDAACGGGKAGSGKGGSAGKGGKAGKAGKGDTSEQVDVVAVLWDHVDEASLRWIASLQAARYIVLSDEHIHQETLRSRALIDLKRLALGKQLDQRGILVPYREDKLFSATGVPGRLVSGLKDLDAASRFHWHSALARLFTPLSNWEPAGILWYPAQASEFLFRLRFLIFIFESKLRTS